MKNGNREEHWKFLVLFVIAPHPCNRAKVLNKCRRFNEYARTNTYVLIPRGS